ncbi:MAG: YggT family protein [Acidobacteria bacterium]|nr:YggT family protein [Acidobacteriota bacterium]
MLSQIYQIISLIFTSATAIFVALLLLRLIFSYTDPNPFGAVGRFGFKIRKITERFVYPAARLLAQFRVDVRFAPLVTIFVAIVIAYFALGIIWTTLFVIGGLTESIANGNVKAFIGFVLYALISVYILFIFIRFLSSWFVFARSTFLGFVQRATDPVLLPARRIIPTIGMFDISAMLVLILLQFLQTIVLRIFVYS